MDGSIFSKASFAATADDLDLDLDDPNFWELWAKKMNVDPSKFTLAGVSAAVDDSRIRRVLRRLLSNSKNDFLWLVGSIPVHFIWIFEEPAESEEIRLWTPEERSGLGETAASFGLTAFDRIRPYFPNRSQNDLIAATKVLLKICIEQVGEEEPKFKEDSEKIASGGVKLNSLVTIKNPSEVPQKTTNPSMKKCLSAFSSWHSVTVEPRQC